MSKIGIAVFFTSNMKIYLSFVAILISVNAISQNTLFDRHYTFGTWTAGWGITILPNSEYVIVGSNDSLTSQHRYNALIVKTDSLGDTLITRQFLTSDTMYNFLFNAHSDDQFRSILKTLDGNLLSMGLTQSYGSTNYYDIDLYLVKFNYNLDTLWTKAISHPNDSTFRPNKIITTSDGNYLIGGWLQSYTNWEVRSFLCKIDSTGNLLWLKSYSNLTQTSNIFSMVETSDHGFLCVGGVYDFNYEGDPVYFKIDSAGNFQWAQITITPNSDANRNIIKTSTGDYLIAGFRRYYDTVSQKYNSKYHFTKIDEAGTHIWDKEYGWFHDGTPLGLLQTPDGGYMMAGGNGAVDVGGLAQGILMKLNANGDSLWARLFGNLTDYGWFWDIAQCDDGGFVMCGETYCCNFTPGVGNTSSLWLVRTDSLGLLVVGLNENQPSFAGAALGMPYPNPARTSTTITSIIPPQFESGLLYLFDITGRQLRSYPLLKGVNQTIIDVSAVASGDYLCVLSVEGYNVRSCKFVVGR